MAHQGFPEIIDAIQAFDGAEGFPARSVLELLFDAVPDPVFIKDAHHRYVFVNRAAAATAGLARESLLGKTNSVFLAPEDVEACRVSEVRVLRGETVREETVKVINNRTHVLEIAWAPLSIGGPGVTHIIGVARDITLRAEMQRELIAARDRERKLRMELDHRVRNTLASLTSLVRITTQRAGCATQCLSAIQSRLDAVRSMHTLLSDRRETPVQLEEVVRASTPPQFRTRMGWVGDRVEVEPRALVPLGMVLGELATNAEKHGAWSPECDGRVEVVWRDGKRPGEVIVEWIERRGPRVRAPEHGDGVGLDLVRGFVESDLSGAAELSFPESGAHHRFTVCVMDQSPQRP